MMLSGRASSIFSTGNRVGGGAADRFSRIAYARNDALRCFHCKTELYATMACIADLRDGPHTAMLAGATSPKLLLMPLVPTPRVPLMVS